MSLIARGWGSNKMHQGGGRDYQNFLNGVGVFLGHSLKKLNELESFFLQNLQFETPWN